MPEKENKIKLIEYLTRFYFLVLTNRISTTNRTETRGLPILDRYKSCFTESSKVTQILNKHQEDAATLNCHNRGEHR